MHGIGGGRHIELLELRLARGAAQGEALEAVGAGAGAPGLVAAGFVLDIAVLVFNADLLGHKDGAQVWGQDRPEDGHRGADTRAVALERRQDE